MDLTQLQYFRAVARMENVSKAAELLHITQPALSKSISRLEAELGTDLFIRSSNSIQLSLAGIKFLSCVDQAVTQLNQGIDEVRLLEESELGSVHFASFTSGIISTPLKDFLLKYPNITVRHSVLTQNQTRLGFERGDIDLALTTSPVNTTGLEWQLVADDELIALVNDINPLANHKQIPLSRLQNSQFALPDPNFGVRSLLENFCASVGFKPTIKYEGNDGEMCMSMVRDNTCVFVIPASVHIWRLLVDMERQPPNAPPGSQRPFPFSVLRITNPVCTFSYGLCAQKKENRSHATDILYEMLYDYFKNFQEMKNSERYEQLLNM